MPFYRRTIEMRINYHKRRDDSTRVPAFCLHAAIKNVGVFTPSATVKEIGDNLWRTKR